jgi:hypothetical protein
MALAALILMLADGRGGGGGLGGGGRGGPRVVVEVAESSCQLKMKHMQSIYICVHNRLGGVSGATS